MALNQWVVTATDAGQRLDVFLSQQVHGLSRSAAARAIGTGEVTIVPGKLKVGLRLQAGDRVTYSPRPPAPASAQAEDLPLRVVYQDADLAVIDKPAGLVTHPSPGHAQGTLVNALLYHLDQLSGVGGTQRPGIVHRLDKDTSGLMLVAKNDLSHQALAQALQARTIHRTYVAVVWGPMPLEPFRLETRIGRDPKDRKKFAVVRSGGRLSATRIVPQRAFRDFALLELELETGRTHQIRVHCQHLQRPVVGDRVYGQRAEGSRLARLGLPRPDRQLLHAARLVFDHPRTGQAMSFTSPWPADLKAFMERLELASRAEIC